MAELIKDLYSVSFFIWNNLIEVAMTLFQTSPKGVAGGGSYGTISGIYNSIAAATIPIATVFFIISLYKTMLQSPPEQQAQKFLMDAIKYCIILFIGSNLWQIMGWVIDFSDGVTSAIGTSGSYKLEVDSSLSKYIEETLKFPDFSLTSDCVKAYLEKVGCFLIFMISGTAMIFIMVASCISIISSAYQRILKPLVILPFSAIAIALGAGSHEGARSMWQYVKTFLGYCLSGALMIICIKVGYTLCTTLVNFNLDGQTDIARCILITVQSAVTPIVISGLIKGCDHMVHQMF